MTASALPVPRVASRAPALRRVALAIVAVCAASVLAGAVLTALNLGTELPEGTDWRVANVGAVRNHVSNVMTKIGAPDRAAAVAMARDAGL